MFKKAYLISLTALLIVAVALLGVQNQPVSAQGEGTPAATEAAQEACDVNKPNQQAERLADAFKVSTVEIMTWHCKDIGFGGIRIAYILAQLTAKSTTPWTVEQIMSMRAEGKGWGEIVKAAGLSMRDVQQALKKQTKAEKSQGNKDKKDDKDTDDQQGNDNKKDNGNGNNKQDNGNKKDNGKDKHNGNGNNKQDNGNKKDKGKN
jgi:hypothetical protein